MRYDIPSAGRGVAKRTLVGLLAASMLMTCVACTGVEDTRSGDPHTLTIAIAGDIETLDRDFSSFPTSNEVNFNTGDMFFQYGYKDVGEDYEVYNVDDIQGRAIESWELSDDAKSIVLHIRQGQTFHGTGNPVTADDFLYFFERNFGVGHVSNMGLSNIPGPEAVTKVDDYTIKIDFTAPAPLFFYLFRDQAQAVYDSKAIKEHASADDPFAKDWAARNDTGSGPYSVESWEPGVQMVLTSNPDYWGGTPYFDKVVLRIVPSAEQRALLLKDGTVDIAKDIPVDQLAGLESADGVNVLSIPSANQILMPLNCGIEPFTDERVRQALAYAVPYDDIVDSIYAGHATRTDGPIATVAQYYTAGLSPYSYDLEKAEQLLADAGYPDGFSTEVHIPTGNTTVKNLAVLLKSEFAKIGVDLSIKEDSAAVFAQGVTDRSFPSIIRDLLFYVDDPHYSGDFTYRSDGRLNWANCKDEQVDRLVDQIGDAWQPSDHDKRQELATEYQQAVIDQSRYLYLAQTDFTLAMRDDITGFNYRPDNLLFFPELSRADG
jgi:peptide/nickel transport system substrate-binding protein